MNLEFSPEDQSIARSLLRGLPPKQRKALILRFWDNYSIFEISKSLRVSWGEADTIIREGLLVLKRKCLNQPRFSRALELSFAS